MFESYKQKRKSKALEEELKNVDAQIKDTTMDVIAHNTAATSLNHVIERTQNELNEKTSKLKEKQRNLDGLRNQVRGLKAEFDDLTHQRQRVSEEQSEVDKALNEGKSEADSLSYRLSEVKDKIQSNEREITSNKKKIEELNKQKIQLEWELKEGKNQLEITSLKRNTQDLLFSKVSKEVQSLTINVSKVNGDIEKAKSDNKRLEDEVKVLQKRKVALSDDLQKKQAIIEAKEGRKARLELQIEQTEREIAESTDKIKGLEAPLEEAQNQLNRVEGILENQSQELKSLNTKLEASVDTLNKKKSYLERQQHARELQGKKLREMVAEIEAADNKIEALNKSITSIEREITLQKKLFASRKAKIEKQNKIFDELNASIADGESKRDENNKELGHLKAVLNENEEHINGKKSILAELSRNLNDLNEKIFDIKLRTTEQAKTIESLEEQFVSNKKTLEHKKEIFSNHEKERARQKSRIDSLELEKQQTLQKIDQVQGKIREIEEENGLLKEKIAELTTERSNLEKALHDYNNKVRSLEKTKVSRDEETHQLKGQIREKEYLVKTQKEFIETLEVELSQIEESYTKGQEESVRLTKAIDANKAKSKELDESLMTYKSRVVSLQNEIKTLINENFEGERALKDRVRTLLLGSEITQETTRKVEKAIAEIQTKKDSQEVILSNKQEEINASIEILASKTRELSALTDEYNRVTEEVEKANREGLRLHNEIKAVKERISEKRPLYEEKTLSLETALIEVSGLQERMQEYSDEERMLSVKIDEKNKAISEMVNNSKSKEGIVKKLLSKVNSLRAEIDRLEIQESNNKRQLSGQTGQVSDLAKDLEELENVAAHLKAKVATQDEEITKGSNYISQLVDKNKSLSQEIHDLEEASRKREALLADTAEQINALEKSQQGKEEKIYSFGGDSQAVEADTIFESTVSRLPHIDNMTLGQSLSSLMGRLETKHFNLSFDCDQKSFDKYSFQYPKDRIKAFEGIISRFVEIIEAQIDIQSESMCTMSIDKTDLKAFLSFSIPNTKITNADAKKVMVPFTKKLLKEFNELGLGIKFKVKMNPSQEIEKLGVHLSLTLRDAKKKPQAEA